MSHPSFSRLFTALKDETPRIQPIWDINPKTAAKTFVSVLGIRTARTLIGPTDPQDMPSWSLPDRCVVKPDNGGNARGVVPLVRNGQGWRSLFGDGTMGWPGWCAWIKTVRQGRLDHPDSYRYHGAWLAEELVWDTSPELPPCDWKFYICGGECFFVSQGRRRSRKSRIAYRWWTPEWKDAGLPRPNRNANGRGLPPPMHGPAMLEAAMAIYHAVPLESPFLRVDMYEDAEGPVFGEITPRPGGVMRLAPDWDRRMGEAWERTETTEAALATR